MQAETGQGTAASEVPGEIPTSSAGNKEEVCKKAKCKKANQT